MLTQQVTGLRLRSQYSKEANKNGNHVAISQQTPRLQKGDVYVNVTTVLFRLIPMQRTLRYSGIFLFAGPLQAAAAKISCTGTSVPIPKG